MAGNSKRNVQRGLLFRQEGSLNLKAKSLMRETIMTEQKITSANSHHASFIMSSCIMAAPRKFFSSIAAKREVQRSPLAGAGRPLNSDD